MANSPQARKRARQAEKRRRHQTAIRSMMRTLQKKVTAAISAKNKQDAEAGYKALTPVLDRLATRGLIHKNKAARHKSRLIAQIKAL